jgi:hypothetical protein
LSAEEEARLVALITACPDATLAALQRALTSHARGAEHVLARAIDRLGLTVRENRHVAWRHPRPV